MLKKLLSVLLVLAILAFIPLVVGCNNNPDIETHRQTEVHDAVVSQDTVVQ